ncbi:MAG: tetratricopeptide repeat protein [Myxococcota bacterium]
MAHDSQPAAQRSESTMDLLLDEIEQADEPRAPSEPPELRSAATLPPPPPPPVTAAAADAARAPGSDESMRARARELIAACEAELTSDPEPRRAGRLHYEIARLYESSLGDVRRASAHYQEALRHVPEHIPTIRGARRTFVVRNNPRAALPLFEAEARLTADPRRKAAIFLAKGRLLEDVLGRRQEAREAYLTAFELDRSEPTILKALEQSYLETADWVALDRILERAANVVSHDSRFRAALVVHRAQVLEARRNDLDGAIELYETALRLDAGASGAIEALKRLHHQQRRFRDLIRVLEVESQHATDGQVRAMALYRIGRIHLEQLGNRDEALMALERAARESPEDSLILEELVPLYESAGRPDRVVEVLDALLGCTPDTEEKVALLERMGALQARELRDPDAAMACYEAALRLSPDHVPTLQALGRLYESQGRLDDVVRIHAFEAEHADEPHRRAAAHVRAAEVLEHRLGRKEDAMDHHARALTALPGHPAAFKGLVRLLSEAHKWRELIEVYERAVERSRRPEEAAGYLFKVGSLYEDALGEHVQASDVYRRILTLVPHDIQAIQALQRTSERAGRWEEYLDALQLEMTQTEQDADKVPILHRMGEVLHERLGDWSAAVGRLREALALDPHHAPTLGTLGRLYHEAGRWEDLLEVYACELELADNDTKRIALLGRMAELCSERIGRDAAAVDYYKRILKIDPSHGQALRAVAALLEEHGDHEGLLQVLRLQVEALDDPQMRARAAFKMAEIHERRLEDPPRALRAYERALEGMPGHRPSLDAVTRLRAAQSSWKALVDGLLVDAAQSPDAFLSVDALVEAGEVCMHRLGDPARAITCYERAREQVPDNMGVLLGLERLYRRIGDHTRLADIYESQARVFEDDGAKLTALRELLRLHVHHGTGSEDDVQRTCEAILALGPEDPLALEVLEGRALAQGDRSKLNYVDTRLAASVESAAERAAHHTRIGESLEIRGEPAALEAYRAALAEDPENIAATRGLSRLAAQMDDPEALAEAARREARVSQDGDTAADLLVQSARMRTGRLGDFDGAIADLIRAIELSPDHAEAAERLDGLLVSGRDEERLVDLLTRAANSARTPERRVALWKRVALLQAEFLTNIPGAIGALNRVLRTAPDDLDAVRRLAELYEHDGQWNEAVNLLHRILQLAPGSEVLAETHLRLAALYDQRMGETDRALVSLQAVLALDPQHAGALRALAELHQREGRPEPAWEAATRLVEVTSTDPDRADALTLLANIERLAGRDADARVALQEAIVLEGPSGAAALDYCSHAEEPDHWVEYTEALWQHAGRRSELTAETYLELARVLADCLDRPLAAVEALELGLQETGGDPDLRRQLAAQLEAAGEVDRAIEQLQRMVDRQPTDASAWRELARMYQSVGRLRDARVAIEPLVALGAATGREHQLIEASPPRPGAVAGSLAETSLQRLTRFGPGDRAAADLMSLLSRGLGKLYPPDLEAFGLVSRDRIHPRADVPLMRLVTTLARAFGGVELDLYVHRIRGRGVCVELGERPALLVPASLPEAPIAQQVFLLSRPLVHAAQGFQAVGKLTPREIEVLLASAARSVQPGYGRGLTSEEFLDDQARRIHKALPRRTRKAMELAVDRYVQAPRVDFPAWCAAVRRTANRVAAVVADDLMAVLLALRATERELSDLAPPELVRTSAMASDLLRFWGSDEAQSLRAELGMAPADGSARADD